MLRLSPVWKIRLVCALTSVGVAFTLLMTLHHPGGKESSVAAKAATRPATTAAAAKPSGPSVAVSLGDALGRNWVAAQYRGNGRDEIVATVANKSGRALRLNFASGLVFNSAAEGRAQVVVARDTAIDLPAGETRPARLATAATRLSNAIGDGVFNLSPAPEVALAALDALLARVRENPETSREALQTAVLLLLENPSLSAFAKFSVLAGDGPRNLPNPEAFRVNTGEILGALTLLKSAGYPRANFAVAHEPQLQIEAMIDPLAHAAALKYYGITPEREWTYWRDELTKGDASTRHYALYGIGRYYPDVALQMLPGWARDKRLTPIFRHSAVQALAETRRPEAISVLHQLVNEFGGSTELGVSARRAVAYLENRQNGVADAATAAGLSFKVTQVESR